MNPNIQAFIDGKHIALVGASRSTGKFGNIAFKELQERGYQVTLIHPEAQEIEGVRCYPNLTAVKGQVDGVLVCVPPTRGEQVLREAAAIGVKNVWLQQGTESSSLLALGGELGLNLVSGKCILMYATPVRSFHRWHRAFVRLTGQL